jgi:flagellar motility protein MotE (MotC chaperone)
MNQFPKDKLLKLDDESFKALVMEINSLAGGDPKKAEKLTADIPRLKKHISKMNESDAKKLLNNVEDEKAREIIEKLNKT